MIEEAEKMNVIDKQNEKIIQFKNKLKEKCLQLKTPKANEIYSWIKEKDRNDNFFTMKELEKKYNELK